MQRLSMRPNRTKGKLITFCGLDGCGKTTMIRRLMAELEKEHQVFLTKQPTDFVRSSAIFRTYMDCPNHDAYDYRSLSLLAASDRVQHGSKVIEPALAQGQIVLSDRYFYSCLANLRARGFEADRWIYEIAESVIRPDIAFSSTFRLKRRFPVCGAARRKRTDTLIFGFSTVSARNIARFAGPITGY